jgi:hypothetical protein
MLSDIRDWLGFGIAVVSFVLTANCVALRSCRRRRRERYRSLKAWGIEWTAYEREDDSQL